MEHVGRLLLRSSPSQDTTPETGMSLGHALAADYDKIVVGMDLTKSSPMMRNALVAGIISSGSDVIDVGRVSGPVIAHAARMGDCAVYITEFRQQDLVSGYLLINKDGCYFGQEQIAHLEENLEVRRKMPDDRDLGSLKEYYNATRDYNDMIVAVSNNVSGGSLILNCNCGMATDSAPQLLNLLGTDVISINAQKDRNFVSDSLSVKEADTRHMRALVESNAGWMGISLNRIGTLCRVFDEAGTPLSDSEVLGLLILYLRPAKVVVPLDISWLVSDIFNGVGIEVSSPFPEPELNDRELIFTELSTTAIHDAMVKSGATLGYYKGGFIFSNLNYSPDAIYTSVVLSQFSGSNNMQTVLESFPKYYSDSKSYEIQCSHEDFRTMFEENLSNVNPMNSVGTGPWRVYVSGGGFYVEFDKDSEDTINVIAESSDRLYLASLMEIIDQLIESCASGQ